MMFAGLMSRWTRPRVVRLLERAAHLHEDLATRAAGCGPCLLHELLEIDAAAEILHRVVEDAVGAAAVVEDGDGVRMGQLAHVLDLALEALEVVGADASGGSSLIAVGRRSSACCAR